MPLPVIAILDVGKTNKKLLLFDEQLNVVFQRTVVLPETTDADGFPCEDVHALVQFVQGALQEVLNSKQYDVRAINFSGYGASFVLVDNNDEVISPIYNYLKPYPEQLLSEFYDSYGGRETFARVTASPVLGSLNSAMQLYRLKREQPEDFSKVKYALHMPQFLSWLVTRRPVSELTSIGCHTNLWDFPAGDYHSWVSAEGIERILPPIVPSGETVSATCLNRTVITGTGLHDSSAALIPYLKTFSEPFVLISTGTWSISLNPFNHEPLTDDELRHDCLSYFSFEGTPVKASRFFIGPEYEKQVRRIAAHYNKDVSDFENVGFDTAYVPEPTPVYRFNERDLKSFGNCTAAYHQLVHELVGCQVRATSLVMGSNPPERIFVDGGFSRNAVFMHYLTMQLPGSEVWSAAMAQGTALGAALAIHSAWTTKPVPSRLIELEAWHTRGAVAGED